MQYQPYKASDNATIQCSNCHKPVQLGLIAEHNCVQSAPLPLSASLPYPTSIPEIRTPPSPAGSFQGPPPRGSSGHFKPQRPVLPKIDSSLAWQNAELTPASSGHGSLLASPVSATSSRTSRSTTRKPTTIRRPPSPELVSQDCAFPPFPGMGTSKPKNSSKERGLKLRTEESRSKITTSAASSARSSSSSPLSHSRTISSASSITTTTRGRSKSVFGEGPQHRPTTAPEGHAPEFSSQLRNITVPPALPSVPPPLLRADTAPGPQTQASETPLTRMPTFDSILYSNPQNGGAEDAGMPALSERNGREPAYKSKRPPPLAGNLAPPPSSNSSKSPTLSSARSLKRTLTEKLFGRKPSKGRRSMVRAALSDEPEATPVPPMPLVSPVPAPCPPPRPSRSPDAEWPSVPLTKSISPVIAASSRITGSHTLSPQDLAAPTPITTEIERQRHASFAALEGESPTPETVEKVSNDNTKPPLQSVSRDLGSAEFDFGLEQTQKGVPQVTVGQAGSGDEAQVAPEGLRRASIDSASSYGSIGFTERTFSSRSSPPPTDEVARKRFDNVQRLTVEDNQFSMPAPLRPRAADSMADSPTDPHCIGGLLSPISMKDKDAGSASSSIDAHVVSPLSDAAEDRPTSSPASSISESYAMDCKPIAGFRSRKDSLAGAPPPLFHNATLPPRVDSKESPLEGELQPLPAERQQHRPRQESLASVNGGGNGIKGTCRGCSLPILTTQKSVSSADGRLSGKYHKDCFACHSCKEPFATAEFYVHGDRPYCAHHYHQLEDSLCATCGHGIEGLYMETANVAGRGKEKHHPTCLKCATCRVQLTSDYFELSGKVYCEKDAFRLASSPRVHSRGPARPSPLVREYIRSGDPGAIRGSNFPERRIGRPMLEIR